MTILMTVISFGKTLKEHLTMKVFRKILYSRLFALYQHLIRPIFLGSRKCHNLS